MENNAIRVEGIIRKISAVIDRHILLEERYNTLLQEKNQLLHSAAEQSEKLKVLENKNKYLKVSKGLSLSEEENSEVKGKIQGYIKEIDKCIELLNH